MKRRHSDNDNDINNNQDGGGGNNNHNKNIKLKKAPQAPRRFKSAYMFYSTQKHKDIRQELKDRGESNSINTTEVAKMVSQAWKAMSTQERKPFEDMAQEDRKRYEYEKARYQGPWKVQTDVSASSSRKLPPGAPKRPTSAFFAFCNDCRHQVKQAYPTMASTEMSKKFSALWKMLDPAIKQKYLDDEAAARAQHKRDMQVWEQEQRRKEEHQQHSINNISDNELLLSLKEPPPPLGVPAPPASATPLSDTTGHPTNLQPSMWETVPQQMQQQPYIGESSSSSLLPATTTMQPTGGYWDPIALAQELERRQQANVASMPFPQQQQQQSQQQVMPWISQEPLSLPNAPPANNNGIATWNVAPSVPSSTSSASMLLPFATTTTTTTNTFTDTNSSASSSSRFLLGHQHSNHLLLPTTTAPTAAPQTGSSPEEGSSGASDISAILLREAATLLASSATNNNNNNSSATESDPATTDDQASFS